MDYEEVFRIIPKFVFESFSLQKFNHYSSENGLLKGSIGNRRRNVLGPDTNLNGI